MNGNSAMFYSGKFHKKNAQKTGDIYWNKRIYQIVQQIDINLVQPKHFCKRTKVDKKW